MTKLKVTVVALGLVAIITVVYLVWRVSQPVKIIALHEGSEILVNTFPLTDRGKIEWWITNKDILEKEFSFPQKYSDGSFSVRIWDIGDGYKKMPRRDTGSDLACFDDMKTDVNCIEKQSYMTIYRYDGGKIEYDIKN
ncbi:MAG: DUF943 family protein, partial [Enterobacteriaceae bacterium]